MSLSEPKISNPCKKFIEFKGDKGIFQYWSKDKKENIVVKYPFHFIVLDELSTIGGFSDSTQSGIYSNEVHSLANQTLNVRTFKGNFGIVGKYADIKDRISKMGGKFVKSVYAGMIFGDKLELVNFRLSGISFSSWMDKKVDVRSQAVLIQKCDDGKKGKVEYKIPIYEVGEVTKELMDQAVEMDKQLQAFLKSYKKQNESPEPEEKEELEEGTVSNPEDKDEIVF